MSARVSRVQEWTVYGGGVEDRGVYKAFMSERLPEALDDAIKKKSYDKFQQICSSLTPQEIHDSLPMCFPMTHNIMVNGKTFRGVARYPLAEWEKRANQ